MQFCVFDFFEEETADIGRCSSISNVKDHSSLNNDDWDFSKIAMVNWPNGKAPPKQCLARIKYFTDSRLDEDLIRHRDSLLGKNVSFGQKRPVMTPERYRQEKTAHIPKKYQMFCRSSRTQKRVLAKYMEREIPQIPYCPHAHPTQGN